MRKRDRIVIYGAGVLGVMSVCLLIYAPVLCAWYGNAQQSSEPLGETRFIEVLYNQVMHHIPILYTPLLTWHGRLLGWSRWYLGQSRSGRPFMIFERPATS